MPGRNDFAIIRAGLLADARAHAAADAYLRAGLAIESTALATVIGHVAMLALWASRDTDDGVLPGDGLIAAQTALLSSRETTKTVVGALELAGLLRKSRKGLYLVGFRDCYAALFGKRETDARTKREERQLQRLTAKLIKATSRADIAATSERRSADVGPYRTEAVAVAEAVPKQNPTEAVPSAAATSNGHDAGGSAAPGTNGKAKANGRGKPLSPVETAMLDAVIDCLGRHVSCSDDEQKFGWELKKALRLGLVEPEDARIALQRFGPRKGIRESVGTARKIVEEGRG